MLNATEKSKVLGKKVLVQGDDILNRIGTEGIIEKKIHLIGD